MDHDHMHMDGSALPPVHWYQLLGHWRLEGGWLLACVLLAAVYLLGVGLARRRGHESVGPLRAGWWLLGLTLTYVTVASGIGIYGEVLFWVHMIEHLALVMVIPTLLALGSPLRVLRASLREPARFDRAVRTPVLRVLGHPGFGFAAYAVVIVATHLTGFMDAMMTSPGLVLVERLLYLVGGWLLLVHLVGVEPLPARLSTGMRLFFSVVMMTPDTVVGIVLLQTGTNLFPAMDAMRPAWAGTGLDAALQDLHTGGALMWAAGDSLMMFVSVGLIVRLISDPQRDRLLGTWLDSARAGTFEQRAGATADADIDDSDDALAAYNQMLGRLDRGH
ncbi:cytochrome c oxidase assembly protein [Nocardioides mangrovicus]|uniref:Cytochrome c oxidase assembly protein n=1 Tax=Nocardioides mangrovicus TaxID=2478913 RepID=A0A3L8P3T6_9ACTN|nr:cytochrome c oxidase assembly protein [Nocardioides mangrovicus]RLV49088.1 cytochrome c oxidase assembly protein [Nocardioides mangrovicus]